MKNLFNFFFSFDKLLKEKLIIPFFWLAIIVWALDFAADLLKGIRLGPLASIFNFFEGLVSILLALIVFRLLAELATAVFRINDNLSPDGGRSELADIDLMAETKKAAEEAAQRAQNLAKSATEKTKSSFENVKENMEDVSDTVQAKAKASTKKTKAKTSSVSKKASDTVKSAALEKPATKSTTRKASTAKSATTKSAPKKRGPKPGSRAPRDKDGNLLKKDGTPRAKPGPKPKP